MVFRFNADKKQVAEILGRNASVSQFFTQGKGASLVKPLHAIVQEVQARGPPDMDSLKRLARGYVRPRLTKSGEVARVQRRNTVRSTRTATDDGGATAEEVDVVRPGQAGRQHIASGASAPTSRSRKLPRTRARSVSRCGRNGPCSLTMLGA
ncbi:hypothetical protein [Streptomyces sp. NPDC057623]|uniref:hypothetical protein n=1 Tax=Streptomyces sp. NPDC057623 TaxID=3346187 RepID=UPI0036917F25